MGCKNIGIRKSELVAKTQYLFKIQGVFYPMKEITKLVVAYCHKS